MKNKERHSGKTIPSLGLCILFISVGFIFPLFGQIPAVKVTEFDVPRDEKFQTADGLVVPWRSGGCKHSNPGFRDKDCYVVTADKYMASDTVTLYDPDGKIWYRFSLTAERADYFLRGTKRGFLPFSTYPHSTPQAVVLRLVRESKNWYEVEVNERTRETKYVLKSDPMWAKDTWKEWLFDGFNLKLDLSSPPFMTDRMEVFCLTAQTSRRIELGFSKWKENGPLFAQVVRWVVHLPRKAGYAGAPADNY